MSSQNFLMRISHEVRHRFEEWNDEFDDESDIELEDDEAHNEHPSSNTAPEPTARGIDCDICAQAHNDITILPPCGHRVCADCRRYLFRQAMQNEEQYPPRCCTTRFTIEHAARVLDSHELQAYRERVEEMGALERLYCAVPRCSKFISPEAVDDEHGTCPQCGRRTHTACQTLEHPGTDCPVDADLDAVFQMTNAEGWQRCEHCGSVIERTEGCNQLMCRCGYQFCWKCGKALAMCECTAPLPNGAGLIQQGLEQLAAVALGPRDDDDFLQYDRILEAAGIGGGFLNLVYGFATTLDDQPYCTHSRRTRWNTRRDGHLVCEICQDILRHFILECENCGLRICVNCRNALE